MLRTIWQKSTLKNETLEFRGCGSGPLPPSFIAPHLDVCMVMSVYSASLEAIFQIIMYDTIERVHWCFYAEIADHFGNMRK